VPAVCLSVTGAALLGAALVPWIGFPSLAVTARVAATPLGEAAILGGLIGWAMHIVGLLFVALSLVGEAQPSAPTER
jgi:hypothetical protein